MTTFKRKETQQLFVILTSLLIQGRKRDEKEMVCRKYESADLT